MNITNNLNSIKFNLISLYNVISEYETVDIKDLSDNIIHTGKFSCVPAGLAYKTVVSISSDCYYPNSKISIKLKVDKDNLINVFISNIYDSINKESD